jgi:hypothetical protein
MEGKGGLVLRGGTLLVCAAAVAAGCGSDVQGVETRDPARTFAPLVRLDPQEDWLPMGARWSLNRSVLWFAHNKACGDQKVAVGRRLASQRRGAVGWLAIRSLGNGPYYHYERDAYGATCDRRQPYTFHTHQQTRPHDKVDRVEGLGLTSGYYLDLMNWARAGQPLRRGLVEAPAYVERRTENVNGRSGLRLTYWMLYGMNEPQGQRGPIRQLTHEGDWEHVDVLLEQGDDQDEYIPIALRLHTSATYRDLSWASVRRGGFAAATHPILSASRGSHALSLISPRESCTNCPQWRTWTNLKAARKQLWYGFGGAWGKPGTTLHTTGPHGPHGKWAPAAPDVP